MEIILITSAHFPGNLWHYCKERNLKIIRLNKTIKSIVPKWLLAWKLLEDALKCFRYLTSLRKADVIISVFFISLPVLIMRKAGFIRSSTRIVWCGFFLHNTKYFKLFRFLFKFLFTPKDNLIVYSEHERELYANVLNLPISSINYIPLVYRSEKGGYSEYSNRVNWNKLPEKYFFSGGYSHRDYVTLINTFKHIPSNLVICSSKLNDHHTELELPGNITLMNDVHGEDFSDLIQRSQACILLLKDDTGAAGQMFTFDAMYKHKVVISSSSSIIKELIEDGVNGFIVENPMAELPELINKIESNHIDKEQMGRKAHDSIAINQSPEKFDEVLNTILNVRSSIVVSGN